LKDARRTEAKEIGLNLAEAIKANLISLANEVLAGLALRAFPLMVFS
jgi:hypothetical protein